jgi:hypothetical protein
VVVDDEYDDDEVKTKDINGYLEVMKRKMAENNKYDQMLAIW